MPESNEESKVFHQIDPSPRTHAYMEAITHPVNKTIQLPKQASNQKVAQVQKPIEEVKMTDDIKLDFACILDEEEDEIYEDANLSEESDTIFERAKDIDEEIPDTINEPFEVSKEFVELVTPV